MYCLLSNDRRLNAEVAILGSNFAFFQSRPIENDSACNLRV